MTIFEVVAIIGALAWMPPIISLISRALKKAIIQVNTAKEAEIGFTSFGPIINLRIALSVEHNDIVLSSLVLKVCHESGETRLFSWQGIIQNLGRLNNPGVGTIPYEKENIVLAIKLNTKDVEERFIRFQEERYLSQKQELLEKIRQKIIFLKNTETFNPEIVINSEEFHELLRFNQQSFGWKIGKYEICLQAKSKTKFAMINNKFTIELDQLDIESMQKNIEYNKMAYINEVKAGSPGYEFVEIQWNWVNPKIINNDFA